MIAMFDISRAISRKRRKIGGKLVLITNRKAYMNFRLVSKSVTLNDLEWRNGHYFCVILPNLVISGAHCVKWVKKAMKFCSGFINSRHNAQYLPSYRLIC